MTSFARSGALQLRVDSTPASDRDRCLRMYSRSDVIGQYAEDTELQPPESRILEILAARLGKMKMLDIGMGAGRLTAYFAPRVDDYNGIDLAPQMVEYCRRRFAAQISPDRFAVRDMRELRAYPDDSFDLVLNSYNTIDHLNVDERARFLGESRRIVSKEGYLCFSAHNSRAVRDNLRITDWHRAWRHPKNTLQRCASRATFLRANSAALQQADDADYIVVKNGTHGDFTLNLCYVRPEWQIGALREAGFTTVRLFSLDRGAELDRADLPTCCDRWLYYLCA